MPHNLVNMPYIAKWMSNSNSVQKITPKDIFTAKNIDSKKVIFWGVVQQKLQKYRRNKSLKFHAILAQKLFI